MGCITGKHLNNDSASQFIVIGSYSVGKTALIRLIQLAFGEIDDNSRQHIMKALINECVISSICDAMNNTVKLLKKTEEKVDDNSLINDMQNLAKDINLDRSNDYLKRFCNILERLKKYNSLSSLYDSNQYKSLCNIVKRINDDNEHPYIPTDHDILTYIYPSIGTFSIRVDDESQHYYFIDVSASYIDEYVKLNKHCTLPLTEGISKKIVLVISLDRFVQEQDSTSITGQNDANSSTHSNIDNSDEINNNNNLNKINNNDENCNDILAENCDILNKISQTCYMSPNESRIILIVFTKLDIFNDQIKNSDTAMTIFQKQFPHYTGALNSDDMIEHIKESFHNMALKQSDIVEWIQTDLLEQQLFVVADLIRNVSAIHSIVTSNKKK